MLYGGKTPGLSGTGQVDLAAVFRAAGADIPAGAQEWQVVGQGTTGGSITDFRYNSATNPLTAPGYSGTGNTGRTPYRAASLGGSVYYWDYQCRVNGGPWSNTGRLTYDVISNGVSIGNNYSNDNYPGALLGYSTGADAYTTGLIRHLLVMTGLSRPTVSMGGGFNFTTSGTRVVLRWANNQLPPTLASISFGQNCQGLWIDLEYDGVTVTRGRLTGPTAAANGKIQLSGTGTQYCRVTRCDLRATESEYTKEFTGSNAWGGIYIAGTDNEIGIAGDYSYANYIEHTFYGVYAFGACVIANNAIANIHGRHIGIDTTATGVTDQENIIGATFRTQVPVLDVANHLDKSWAQDGSGGNVAQNSRKRNTLMYSGLSNSAARLNVFGSTGATLDTAAPEMRGCICWDAYGYSLELGRWSGRARITDNDCGMLGTGDYSTAPAGAGYDVGAFGARPSVTPAAALTAGSTLEYTGNVFSGSAPNSTEFNAIATAALEAGGTNVYRNRGAVTTNYVNGDPATYLANNAPTINGVIWGTPTKKSDIDAILAVFWSALRRDDGLGPVNSSGTGWKTLSA